MSELSNWRVETLRLTVFASKIPDIDTIDWWEKLVNEPPETKTVQPRSGTLQEVGAIKNGLCNLSLECQAQRIDWHLTPIVKADEQISEFPSFAGMSEGLDLFQELLEPWLSDRSPEANRIAFGAILTQAVPTKEAGYELLGHHLPSVKLDPIGSSDLVYQINRPRTSHCNVPGLQVNRLSRWTVARLSGVMVQLSVGGKMSPQVVQARNTVYVERVELDVNTFRESEDPLPADKRVAIFKELIELGVEIASKGDVS
jgi:hypothetical protein